MQKIFKKIIEKLEDAKPYYNRMLDSLEEKRFEVGQIAGLNDAIEIVKQAAEEYNNGWIPVSESLPEEKINPITDDFYIYPVMYKDGDVTDIKYFHFGYGHWHHGFEIMDDYVTHWMDIKPYQPKGE